MYSNAALIVLLLGVLSLPAGAVPQTRQDRAYPQESYAAEDYHAYAPQTVFDLLQRLPGVSLAQLPDGQSEIRLHGIDSRYLLLLINGQPLSGNSVHNTLLTRQIPASLVQRVDIDRNARADLFNGGGGGGTVNIILHDGFSPSGLQISASIPDRSHQQTGAVHLLGHNILQAARLGAEQRTQHDERKGSTTDAAEPWSAEMTHQEQSVLLSYNGLLNDRHPIRLYALHLSANDDQNWQGISPFETNVLTGIAQADTERRHQRFGGDVQLQWDRWQLQLHLMHEQFRQTRIQTQSAALPLSQKQEISDQRLSAGWQLHQTGYEHKWTTGLNLHLMRRRTDYEDGAVLMSNALSLPTDRSLLAQQSSYDEIRISYFLLDRWQITPDTRLEAGFHTDNYLLRLNDENDSRNSDTRDNTHWLPSFHLLHQLDGRTHLRLSMSQSTRQPDIADRIPYEYRQAQHIWQGNPDLDAETITSFDLSYEYHPRQQGSSRSDRSRGNQLRVFQRRISNSILMQAESLNDQGESLTRFTPQNADGTVLVRGVEADIARQLPWDGARAEAGLGWYQTRAEAPLTLATQQFMPAQPEYLVRFGVSRQVNQWHVGMLWRMQGERDAYQPNAVTRTQQHWDGYLERHWQHWRTGFTVAFKPETANQPTQWQDTQEHWHLRLTVGAQF